MTRQLGIPSVSIFTFALLSACVDEPGTGPEPDDEGISIDDTSTTDVPTDLPGDGDGDEQPPTCETTTAVANTVPPNVMLVIDKSRSMITYKWDDDGDAGTADVTRWYSLHHTVADITSTYEQGMSLGLTLFPSLAATSEYDEACLVEAVPEVGNALGNAAAILAAIPPAESLDLYGATPTAAGISTALAHLESLDESRPAAMILITDGAANCGAGNSGQDLFGLYDEQLPAVVADAWQRAGIPTYVIGIDIHEESVAPYTQPREKLDELAQLGGVPRPGEVGFYDATSADALTAALDDISSSVSCTVQLGKAPGASDLLIVSIDGQPLDQLDSCAEGDGWTFVDPDGALDQIELCNAACDALLDAGEIEAEFLCPPQP